MEKIKSFNEWLAEKGIDKDAYTSKEPAEMASLQREYLQYFSTEAAKRDEGVMTLEGLKAFIKADENKELFPKEDMTEFTKRLEEAEEALKLIREESEKGDATKSLKEQIKEQLLADQEGFNALRESKGGRMNLTVKVAGDMLISTNITGRVARIEVDSERTGIARRNPFVLDVVRTGRTTANTLYWIQRVNHDGSPAMTAEGAAKPQIDWDYVEASTPVRKAAAWTKISKEMMDDVDGMAEDIALELTEQIQLLVDAQLLTGDGAGQNLVGIAENATAFAPGTALANTITSANDFDAIRAALAQVNRANFTPNVVVVHPDKLAAMDMAKGTDGHYVMPPFKASDGTVIAGVRVVANNGVGADVFYVGDFTKYVAKIRENLNISVGYDGDDWTKNMMTPLAEMRIGGYIKSNHYGAIVTGTFTVAKALLDPSVADS